jgi:hypothetical protein
VKTWSLVKMPRMIIAVLSTVLAALATFYGSKLMASDNHPASITVTMALLWEGEPLGAANVESLKAFREQFKSLKIVHLISPAYFTRSQKDNRSRESNLQQMRDMIAPEDLAGIYLNGWKSLAEAAQIPFKNSPTFWGNQLSIKSCLEDCGREVLLTAYTPQEIRKIIKKSRSLFIKQGFGQATLMQVAGHAASPEILAAASAEGITHDFSAIAVDHFNASLKRFPLMNAVNELWNGVGPTMRPFELKTGSGSIMQMTSNGLPLEMMSESDIIRSLDRVTGSGDSSTIPEGVSHLFIGVPMETLAKNMPKLELSTQELFRRSSVRKFSVKWFADSASGVAENRPNLKVQSAH